MKTLKIAGLCLFIFINTFVFASADNTSLNLKALHGGDWVKLGSRVVNMHVDHDEIPVTVMDGVFTKVKLKIMKAPIHLLNINIVFGNGTHENVVFNKLFPAGSSTRVIDLVGNKRIIKKVKLNYKSVPTAKGRAIVSLWGRH